MPYFLFYISILSFLVPLVHLLLSFIGIKAQINLPDDSLYTGVKIEIEYRLKNKNFFSIPMINFSSDISKILSGKKTTIKTLSLGPFEDFRFRDTIRLKRRGFYELVDLKVEISDIYSLFTFKKEFHNKTNLLVYPNIIELDSFKIYSNKNLGELSMQDSIFEDKTSISSIKEYTEGDSINQIHWKVSAKRGTPMVKSFEPVSNANLNIFINNNKLYFKDDFDRHIEDKIVDTSLAIVNYLLNLDIDLSLNTFSKKELIEISNIKKENLKVFLEMFARFKGNGESSIIDLIEEKMYSFIDNSMIMIITPNLDKEMGEIALKLKMKNLIPIFIIVTDKENNDPLINKDIENRLTEENIELYFIDYNSNIKEELEIKHGKNI
ncbi:DUF58 domain-containing protein [Tissierella creatinophila]|uniref:DUF58 domain-containing protein n=1 Tax=Tissierella creatinophila DSM 6911 TaxID=1123403 RepID=A0A1U7M8L6_TISCR|nr:DUF58 domain-containing protein [Tissierella creatinophila]OLS03621.1 hypothetical protein TICRE_03150 [Tissierella creatinophila DSM 6911]